MKFIVDTQLPPKLSILLRHLGYDSVHTTDYPNGHLMNDYEIIEIAKVESRIIVTKDKDFFDNYILFGPPPSILFIKVGNINNEKLLDLIKSNKNSILSKFDSGVGFVLLSLSDIISL